MTVIQSWKRIKFPEERDVRYAYFEKDLPTGETITTATAVVESGDVVVDSVVWTGTTVTLVISAGTKNSVIRITITSNTGKIVVGKAFQRLDGAG